MGSVFIYNYNFVEYIAALQKEFMNRIPEIFKEEEVPLLVRVFEDNRRNLLMFYTQLSGENRYKLIDYITKAFNNQHTSR